MTTEFSWLKRPALQQIFNAFPEGSIRVVGGAVRDSLLGLEVSDYDFATSLTPDQTIKAAQDHAIKVVPTGISHGTVTLVVDGVGHEVTTLRCDQETDGRHAVVAYTDDWRADAARRDFTMNALYLSPEGEVFDYFDGLADLRAGRVRFIGDASERVREDYLRILRYFRFVALRGGGQFDQDALAAIKANGSGLQKVAVERQRVELVKLLAAPKSSLCKILHNKEFLVLNILSLFRIKLRKNLIDNDFRWHGQDIGNLRYIRLVSHAVGNEVDTPPIYSLKRSEKTLIKKTREARAYLGKDMGQSAWRRSLYRAGGLASLIAVAAKDSPSEQQVYDAQHYQKPTFPINAQHLIDAGIKPGKYLGDLLKSLEEDWLESGFTLTKTALLSRIQGYIGATGDC